MMARRSAKGRAQSVVPVAGQGQLIGVGGCRRGSAAVSGQRPRTSSFQRSRPAVRQAAWSAGLQAPEEGGQAIVRARDGRRRAGRRSSSTRRDRPVAGRVSSNGAPGQGTVAHRAPQARRATAARHGRRRCANGRRRRRRSDRRRGSDAPPRRSVGRRAAATISRPVSNSTPAFDDRRRCRTWNRAARWTPRA